MCARESLTIVFCPSSLVWYSYLCECSISRARLNTSAAIRHSAFSHDGELIAIGGDDTFIAVVSVGLRRLPSSTMHVYHDLFLQ